MDGRRRPSLPIESPPPPPATRHFLINLESLHHIAIFGSVGKFCGGSITSLSSDQALGTPLCPPPPAFPRPCLPTSASLEPQEARSNDWLLNR